jgi:hypothetical protein
MSWDIALFNTSDKIEDFEQFVADNREAIDFNTIFEKHFLTIKNDGKHREIVGKDFSIDYFIDDGPVTNKMLSLYGENGLYELVYLAKKFGWQIFDTGNGQMLDLDDPSKNGYKDFQNYLKHVLTNRSDT